MTEVHPQPLTPEDGRFEDPLTNDARPLADDMPNEHPKESKPEVVKRILGYLAKAEED